ncbi:cell division protein PerM [Microbacterium gorillae]|uniref:cell division protein PerM n=1 Tax=Microbacterium gorillae TaxID=1231063 RepID=UPI000A68A2DE|nr:DUF6350 family protein [Microbacterium gorillae]
MHRIVIALLAALDAFLAAAVGVAVIAAPLALFWATGFAGDWAALWPTTGAIWQLGHLVPFDVHVPQALLTLTGISEDAAHFTLSLAPLAFAAGVAVFSARSGTRAARNGGWVTGVVSGTLVFAALAALVHLTSRSTVVASETWQAALFPALVYAVPLLIAAIVEAWREGDGGIVDRLHDLVDESPVVWNELPALAARGLGIVLASFIGLGALGVLVTLVLHGGEMIALYQSAQVDLWGAILLTLAQLAYLPTLIIWAFAWIAGPGFTVGVGTAVSPAGTHLGVLPGVPVLALVPEGGSVWLLALVLLPIAAGALAGWSMRSRYADVIGRDEPFLPRLVLLLTVSGLAAGVAAAAASLASGSLGPGRLAEVGPHPGWVALAVGIEVLIGAGVLLLSPRRAEDFSTGDGRRFDDDAADEHDDDPDGVLSALARERVDGLGPARDHPES